MQPPNSDSAQLLLQSCRLCLCADQDVDLYSDSQKTVPYVDLVESLLDIKIVVHTNIPDRICMECAYNLRLFHKFRTKCESAHARIMELIGAQLADTDDDGLLDCRSTVAESEFTIDLTENELKAMVTAEHTTDAEDEPSNTGVHCSPVDLTANETDDENTEIVADFLQSPSKADDQASVDDRNEPSDNRSVDCDDGHAIACEDDEEAVVEYLLDELEQSVADENETSTNDELDDLVQLLDADDDCAAIDSPSLSRLTSPATVEPAPVPPVADAPHHQPRPSARFACEQCGRLFGRKFTLDQHRRTHTGAKDYECTLCRARFTRSSHLEAHLRIHRNVRPHVCAECARSFTKSSDLLRHLRVHSDRRDFQCAECAKRFKRSRDLQVHQLSHNGVRPHVCRSPDCGKAYTSHSSLKKHRLRWHPEDGRAGAGRRRTAETTEVSEMSDMYVMEE